MHLPVFTSPKACCTWLQSIGVQSLSSDSREIQAGDAFLACSGYGSDGRLYLKQAVQKGALACLVEARDWDSFSPAVIKHLLEKGLIAAYPNLKAQVGSISSYFYGEPSQVLQVIAVTGTNGKTSIAWWLAQALESLPLPYQKACGFIGTLGSGQFADLFRLHTSDSHNLGTTRKGTLTTPDGVDLQKSLSQVVRGGCQVCTLEASSIGIAEHRLDATLIHTAIFSNLSQDHLDFHDSMESYWQAKQQLFYWPGLRYAILNIDDVKGQELELSLKQKSSGLSIWTTSSTQKKATLYAQTINEHSKGISFQVVEGQQKGEVITTLSGRYNVDNLLLVIAGLRTLGIPLSLATAVCTQLSAPSGRLQRVKIASVNPLPQVYIDYAHTPDALAKSLQSLRPLTQIHHGKLWCIFGCGGNRDKTKRPLMGQVAKKYADKLILTNDNPRYENPQHIIQDICLSLTGFQDYVVCLDRSQAIVNTVLQACPRDVVLIAGRGHEQYQQMGSQYLPLDDYQLAYQALSGNKR
jgi:UDP-N-acetylmuramoyl-L-alanyl-D-glutamate--2,6-diaminopimelate ligase